MLWITFIVLSVITDIVGASKKAPSLTSSSLSVQQLLHDSANKWWSRRWQKARELVELEQSVEDYNGDYMATSTSEAQACRHRRLIALPLQDSFDPPMGVFSHGHLQTGDKMSLPKCFWTAINLNKAEVPWLFSVSRIPETEDNPEKDGNHHDKNPATVLVTPPRVEFCHDNKDSMIISEHIPADASGGGGGGGGANNNNNLLTMVVGGPLDFRAPPSYIFLPWWMMRALGIRPGEVVQVDLFTTTPPGSLAKLRPHTKAFAKSIAHPQAVLETELRHYSSLTKGTTIAMDYNGQRYWFDVVDCKAAPKGESVPFIKVQDCDIATDFLTDRETLAELAKKKRQQQPQQEEEHELQR